MEITAPTGVRRVSVVIPAYNEAEVLPGLLSSLAPVIGNSEWEVWVVDNGSTDRTAEVAREAGASVVAISKASPGCGRNVGAAVASGKILAFLDADVVVTTTWLAELQRISVNMEQGGVLTGDVYDIRSEPSWIEQCWFGSMYRRGIRKYINGGNLVIAREDFVKLGGFNESLVSGEDVEFCERAGALGLQIIPNRSLHVIHFGYPRRSREFLAREEWHGRADFRSIETMRRSPVALLTLAFIVAHTLVLIFVVTRMWSVAAIASLSIAILCIACSAWKWRGETIATRIANSAVFYLYFAGRANSALGVLRDRLKVIAGPAGNS